MELDDLQGHLQSSSSYDSVTLWFYDFAFLLEQFLVFAVERFQKPRTANVRLRGRRKYWNSLLAQFRLHECQEAPLIETNSHSID